MDNAIVSAKAAKLSSPPPAPAKPPEAGNLPNEPVTPVNRGIAVNADPPEGTPGIQPTLAEKSSGEDLIPTDPWETSPMFHEIANYFNIEQKFINAEKDKISVITDYAIQQTGSNKLEDIYHLLNNLQTNLLRMDAFEKPHNLLYRYIRLRAHADAANSAVKAFERGPNPEKG